MMFVSRLGREVLAIYTVFGHLKLSLVGAAAPVVG